MPGQTDSLLLQADLTNSPSRIQLLAEQRHSFAIGVYVEDSDHIPVDITGCTITMTAVFPPHKGGGVAISKVADLVDGVAGHAQLSLQAADLDLAAAQYEFAVSLLTPFGFSSPVAKGFLEVASNPDPGYVDEEYTDLGPPGSITFTIGTNYVVGVQVNHLASPTSVPGAPGEPGAPGAPGPPGPPGASGQTGQPHNGSILGFPGLPDTTTVVSTPWPAGWTPAGDLDLRALIAPKQWAAGVTQSIMGVFDPAGSPTGHSFVLNLVATGRIALNVSVDGTVMNTCTSVASPPGAVDGQPLWIRATYTAATASRTFYTSGDGVSWTPFETKGAPGPGLPKKSTRSIQVGLRDGATLPYSGLVYVAEIRDGIGGAVKANLDFRGQWTGTGSAGNVWTISGKPYWYVPPVVPGATGVSAIRSVKDYGANGDDLTGAVNTPAIQQALDELPAGGTLLFPEAGGALNRYRVNKTLLTPKNGAYHLTGPSIPTNAWWGAAVLEAAPGANLVAIMAGRSWYTNGADGGKKPPAGSFSNLFFYGGGFSEEDGGKHDKTIETTANTQYCLVAHGSNVKITNCTFESANVDGLLFAGSIGRDGKSPVGESHEMWIESCGIRYCGRDGFHANAGAQDGYISTTKVQYAGRHAFANDNGASAWVFDHCHPSRCGSDMFHIGAQWQCMINHCYLDAVGDFMDGVATPWRAAGDVRYGIWMAGGDDNCIHVDHNFGQTESTGHQKDPVVLLKLKGWVVATNNHLRYQRTDSSVTAIEDTGSTPWSVITGNVIHMPAAPSGTLNLVPDPSNEAGSWYSGSKQSWPGAEDTGVFDSRTQSIKTIRQPVNLSLNNLSVVYITPEDVDDPRAVPVLADDVLTMSLRVRCNQATWRARIQVNFADAAGVIVGGQPSSGYVTFNDQSWHTLSLANVVVPAGAAYVQMQGNIAMPNGTFPVGGEICWFDSAILNPGTTPLAYFDGYSPGATWLGDPDASASQIL